MTTDEITRAAAARGPPGAASGARLSSPLRALSCYWCMPQAATATFCVPAPSGPLARSAAGKKANAAWSCKLRELKPCLCRYSAWRPQDFAGPLSTESICQER